MNDSSRQPKVRIFLPTYRRAGLLPRALQSLQRQTFTDWICEVHNDAPDDPAPGKSVAQLCDPRFEYHPHPRNLGGTETFNLFYRAAEEPFYAMLEDDNAWQPGFLSRMLAVAAEYPDVTVFWSNQSIWEENSDGSVRDTGTTVHPAPPGQSPRRIPWGSRTQLLGAVHANGSALFRSRRGDAFVTPAVPLAMVEAFRERLFPYPLVYVPEPLAQFTRTTRSSRSNDHGEWAILQTMVAATYLKHAGLAPAALTDVWREARAAKPPATNTLLLASFLDRGCRAVRAHAQPVDWLRLFRSFVRRPRVLPRVLASPKKHPDWWEFLDRTTAAQFKAARA
jgi:glycosyltransferase involved in cell wall biosynthesis